MDEKQKKEQLGQGGGDLDNLDHYGFRNGRQPTSGNRLCCRFMTTSTGAKFVMGDRLVVVVCVVDWCYGIMCLYSNVGSST
jgi:hypothetical protein